MRHVARCAPLALLACALIGCKSGSDGYSPSWSFSQFNPFKSSQAGSDLPPPPSSEMTPGYSSTSPGGVSSDRSATGQASSSDAYPTTQTSYDGMLGSSGARRSGTTGAASAGSLPGLSSNAATVPQRGLYDTGTTGGYGSSAKCSIYDSIGNSASGSTPPGLASGSADRMASRSTSGLGGMSGLGSSTSGSLPYEQGIGAKTLGGGSPLGSPLGYGSPSGSSSRASGLGTYPAESGMTGGSAGGTSTGGLPYGQTSPAASGTGYTPGQTNYVPGNTGYNPPGVPPYTSPSGNYSSPTGSYSGATNTAPSNPYAPPTGSYGTTGSAAAAPSNPFGAVTSPATTGSYSQPAGAMNADPHWRPGSTSDYLSTSPTAQYTAPATGTAPATATWPPTAAATNPSGAAPSYGSGSYLR